MTSPTHCPLSGKHDRTVTGWPNGCRGRDFRTVKDQLGVTYPPSEMDAENSPRAHWSHRAEAICGPALHVKALPVWPGGSICRSGRSRVVAPMLNCTVTDRRKAEVG